MSASSSEAICAFGEKVCTPSKLEKRGLDLPGPRSKPTRPKNICLTSSKPVSSKHTSSSREQDIYSSQLGDLSRTLVFSEEAVSTLSPATISYASAKQQASKLFCYHPSELGIQRRVGGAGAGGRYNTRGPGARHLPCNLGLDPVWSSRKVEYKKKKKHVFFEESPSSTVHSKNYVAELGRGAKPVHVAASGESTILLDNASMFRKVLQPSYPQHPGEFSLSNAKQPQERKLCSRGHRRWRSLPLPIEPSEDLTWQSYERQGSVSEVSEAPPSLSSEKERYKHRPSLNIEHLHKDKQEFFTIMKEWSQQWKLHIRLKEIEDDDALLVDMIKLCENSRMLAVASVAVLAENEAALATHEAMETDSLYQEKSCMEWCQRRVSEEMTKGLVRLVNDPAAHIRVPSAVALYCIDKQTAKATEVLHSSLCDGSQCVERWAAVQCLVCAKEASANIISELLCHLFTSRSLRSSSRQTRAAQLLARTSTRTSLVHAMVADYLNNSGWQERLAACNLLPMLHNGINRDLCDKLLVLTWEDWSPEVKLAASRALGLTSHGKMIHDEIASRLIHPSPLIRLDAIKKLHSLQLMTTNLLPNYLLCFKDKHLSIQLEAIALSGALRLSHPLVIKALKDLILQDSGWILKARALRAVADIGFSDEDLTEQLVWTVRFEKLAVIRAEACQTIASLNLREEKVLKVLKDLVTVEDEPLVLRTVRETLHKLGHTDLVTDDMLESVCEAVKHLGTKEGILAKVVAAEATTTTKYVIDRPDTKMTARDYLDHNKRSKAYPGVSGTSGGGGLCGVAPIGGSRLWTPDRKTIDAQLEEISNSLIKMSSKITS